MKRSIWWVGGKVISSYYFVCNDASIATTFSQVFTVINVFKVAKISYLIQRNLVLQPVVLKPVPLRDFVTNLVRAHAQTQGDASEK